MVLGYSTTKIIQEEKFYSFYQAKLSDDEDSELVLMHQLRIPTTSPTAFARSRFFYERLQKISSMYVLQIREVQEIPKGFLSTYDNYSTLTLGEYLNRKRLEIPEILKVAEQICFGLSELHQQDIVHRELNLKNIFYDPEDGNIRLYVPGVAFLLGLFNEGQNEKNKDVYAFCAPEQTGRIGRKVDFRADLYALGVVLYKLFSGKLPFQVDSSSEMLHAHIARKPIPIESYIPSLPHQLGFIVHKLLAKSVEDRYQTAEGLAHDLNLARLQYEKDASVLCFSLGEADQPRLLQDPHKIYGREKQHALLLKSFERAKVGGLELVVVSGDSGLGKSVFVENFIQEIPQSEVFSLSGRFDQYKQTTPYHALTEAMQGMVQHLLMKKEKEIKFWKARILSAVGAQGQLLLDLIPEFELIIGSQTQIETLGPTESRSRLSRLFLRLLGVLARKEQPLVLFIDDLQWADVASLELMGAVFSEPALKYVLFIVALRDREVEKNVRKDSFFSYLERVGLSLQKIELRPLNEEEMGQLLVDVLRIDLASVRPLLKPLKAKTGGNPFFLFQLLKTLQEDGTFFLDPQGRWSWNIESFWKKDISKDIISLLMKRVGQLPDETQSLLAIGACLGSSFKLSELIELSQIPFQSVFEAIVPAEDAEIIRLDGEHLFFLHTHIQESFYERLSVAEKERYHYKIGEMLLIGSKEGENKDFVFPAAEHFNRAIELIEPDDYMWLVLLNLKAGKRAALSSAYESACLFLDAALSLLTEGCWEEHYETTYELHIERAFCLFILGEVALANEAFDLLLKKARTIYDQVRVYECKVLVKTSLGQSQGVLEEGKFALEILGLKVPKNPNGFHLYWLKFQNEIAQGFRDTKKLDSLPEAEGQKIHVLMSLLNSMLLVSFLRADSHLPFFVSLMVKLSLKNGSTEFSALAYIVYGVLLASTFGQKQKGEDFCQLGLKIIEKSTNTVLKGRCLAAYASIFHVYTAPVEKNLLLMQEAYSLSLNSGDLTYLYPTSRALVLARWCAGRPLHELITPHSQIAGGKNDVKNKNNQVFNWSFCSFSNCLTKDSLSLDFEHASLNEEWFFLQKDLISPVHQRWFFLLKAFILYIAGEYLKADTYMELAGDNKVNSGPAYQRIEFVTISALTALASLPSKNQRQKARSWRIFRKSRRLLVEWNERCPSNFAHRLYFLDAEQARAKNDFIGAMELYDLAIQAADENSFTHFHAIICERAGNFHLGQGRKRFGESYIREAELSYRRWGAYAKVASLYGEHTFFIDKNRLLKESTLAESVLTKKVEKIDFSSIARASDVMVGVTEISVLLERLMKVILENAGAERGVLLFSQSDRLFVEAEGTIDLVHVRSGLPFERYHKMAHSIVNYVRRTEKFVVLGSAFQGGVFSGDPYIIERRSRSILCLPLVLKKVVSGILYLENDLTDHAFTPERIELLRFLSSQIVTSLNNAYLYRDLKYEVSTRLRAEEALRDINALLEQKVEERTRELRIARDEAENAAKAKSEFLAMMSHEVRTPLNGILGMAYLLKSSHLTPGQKGYVQILLNSGEILLQIINDILDFSKIEAGKLVLENIDFNIRDNVDEVCELLFQKATDKGLNMTFWVASDIPQMLTGDSIRYRQILLNLVDNAIKFTETGQVSVRFEARSQKDNSICLSCSVQDSGIGIPKEKLEGLFDSFSQVDASTTRRYGGTGLGLAISKRLIEAMNGTVEVESLVDQGTHFRFIIPFKEQKTELVSLDTPFKKAWFVSLGCPCEGALSEELKRYSCEVESLRVEQLLERISQREMRTNEILFLGYPLPSTINEKAFAEIRKSSSSLVLLVPRSFNQEAEKYAAFSNVHLLPHPFRRRRLWRFMSGDVLLKEVPKEVLTTDLKKVNGKKEHIEELDVDEDFTSTFILKQDNLGKEVLLGRESKLSSQKQILIVEDNRVNQLLVKRFVERMGFACQVVEDGSKVVGAFSKRHFDLILMDCQMPVVDGFAATSAVRRYEEENHLERTPVIAMTANAMSGEKERCLKGGMDDYLSKPFKAETLSEKLAHYLETKSGG